MAAITGAMISTASVILALFQIITDTIAMMIRVSVIMTFNASVLACATCSVS